MRTGTDLKVVDDACSIRNSASQLKKKNILLKELC